MKGKLLLDPNALTKLLVLDKPELASEAVKRIQRLRINIAKDGISAKRAIDELSHAALQPSGETNVELFKEQYRWFRDNYGEYSAIYTSVCKMIVTFERSRSAIIKEVKERNQLPAAYNKSLIASSNGDLADAHVIEFADEAYETEVNNHFDTRHQNTHNLAKVLRKRFKRYMKKLKPKLYLLRNGSKCRFKDGPDLQDIEGMIYVTPWQLDKIQNEWKPIIDYFKIKNFDDNLVCLEATNVPAGTYGSINYAPDDSWKERISYSVDPAPQIISKAIHDALDYAVKDLACNGTYHQMSVIRNIIRKGHHKTGLCVSTDMSKYSDTLQFWSIQEILDVIGIPENVVNAMADLYTLPMWDSVLKCITPVTSASYQGQYGDFPMITAVNIWNQCVVYDYVNYNYGYKYIVDLQLHKDKKSGEMVSYNSTNSAVGDDTIMVFPHPKDNLNGDILFNIIRAVFNRDGVNINYSKTHILDHGKGCCDFIKRVITSEGLVPYFRIEGICGSFDDKCAELLRFYRDNIVSDDQFKEYCIHFLGPIEGWKLYHLHPINGGVIDREIDEMDLRCFIRRHESLECRYRNRKDDELRQWFRHIEARGIDLSQTALIGFVDQEAVISDISGEDENGEEIIICFDDGIAEYEEYECTHEDVKRAILQTHMCGFKYFKLVHLHSMVGHTLAELRRSRPELAAFLDDYQRCEAYRYMTSQLDHISLTTYTDMFSSNFLPFKVSDELERIAFADDIDDIACYKSLYLNNLICRRSEEHITDKFCWGKIYYYYQEEEDGPLYRLYPAATSKYEILPFNLFEKALGCYVDDEGRAKLKEIYISYSNAMREER